VRFLKYFSKASEASLSFPDSCNLNTSSRPLKPGFKSENRSESNVWDCNGSDIRNAKKRKRLFIFMTTKNFSGLFSDSATNSFNQKKLPNNKIKQTQFHGLSLVLKILSTMLILDFLLVFAGNAACILLKGG